MNDSAEATARVNGAPETHLAKLTRRISVEGLGALPRWVVRWLYWNRQIYHVLSPQRLGAARAIYKRYKPFKKYGIAHPILVFQMGKVGSTSIYNTLQALDLDVSVDHIHYLNNIDKYEAKMQRGSPPSQGVMHMMERSREIRREMERAPEKKWNVISLVRTPIGRIISGLFENLSTYFPHYQELIARQEMTAEKLVDFFLHDYKDRTPLAWFDLQVKPVLGIDVFATPFPKACGYAMYAQDNIRMLVIRMEDLDHCGSTAMREFLDIPDFTLLKRNVGEQKDYAQLYLRFLELLRLPDEFISEYHSSKYAQHFYTSEELAASVRKWRD